MSYMDPRPEGLNTEPAPPSVVETLRAGGRRWLTKKAAYRAAAREKLRQRCECDRGDEFTPGETCRLHADPVRYQKLIRRLAFHYASVDATKPPQSLFGDRS
ncbi:hypothetical protein [Pandoraea sp. CB10b_02]|uniref:hypothetical protein n=1 Tax=Pandoraea sp. CB10b_02 TaxID=2014535 RepID=UPI00257E5EBE|nr:hypothetical protein [Pandoraea sp. CB10b_02]